MRFDSNLRLPIDVLGHALLSSSCSTMTNTQGKLGCDMSIHNNMAEAACISSIRAAKKFAMRVLVESNTVLQCVQSCSIQRCTQLQHRNTIISRIGIVWVETAILALAQLRKHWWWSRQSCSVSAIDFVQASKLISSLAKYSSNSSLYTEENED